METYYSNRFLEYVKGFKWSYYIMEETSPHLDIIYYQLKPQYLERIIGQRGPIDPHSRQHR